MTENVTSSPRSPRTPAEWENYFDLRWRVLRAPWNQPRGSEKDDRETDSEHLMIVGPDSSALAVGRLHFNTPTEAQVRFMIGACVVAARNAPIPTRAQALGLIVRPNGP